MIENIKHILTYEKDTAILFIKKDWWKALIGIIFSCAFVFFSTYCEAFDNVKKWTDVPSLEEIFSFSPEMTSHLILQCVVLSLVCLILFYFWSRPYIQKQVLSNINDKDNQTSENKIPLYVIFFSVMILLLLMWSPYIITYYPGAFRDDTWLQLSQWYGYSNFSDHNPIYDTIVFGSFFSLGDMLGNRALGLFIYVILQSTLIAAGLSATITYLYNMKVPKILLVVFVILLGTLECICHPVITMSKDAFNMIFFIPLVLCCIEIIRTDGNVLKKYKSVMFFLIALIILCTLSKRPMIYVILATFLAYTIYELLRKIKHKDISMREYLKETVLRPLCVLLSGVLIAIYVITPIMNTTLNVGHVVTKEMYSIFSEQIVYTLLADEENITNDEIMAVNELLDIEAAKEKYNPHRSDEVSTTYWSGENVIPKLLPAYIKLMEDHTQEYTEAFFLLSGGWFSLDKFISYGDFKWTENFYDRYANNFGGSEAGIYEMDKFGLSYRPLILSEARDLFSQREKQITKEPFILFDSFGFYCSYLPLLLFLWTLLSRRWRAMTATALPVLLFMLCIVGPIVLYWYTMPLVFLTPLFLSIPIIMSKNAIKGENMSNIELEEKATHTI